MLDCMISDPMFGWTIAKWVCPKGKRFGVSEVIYRQHIWTVRSGSESWRLMSDLGSPTASRMDHVHVSVYGDSGTASLRISTQGLHNRFFTRGGLK